MSGDILSRQPISGVAIIEGHTLYNVNSFSIYSYFFVLPYNNISQSTQMH